MTSQTEPLVSPYSPSVCAGGGELRREVAALDPFLYQEMRWCAQREELQPFVFMCESATRRAGVCLGCGEYGEERFSRTVSEERAA